MFGKQLANVIEWADEGEGVLFCKWDNEEIKKGSVLILRPGQDAAFFYNGKLEGIFREEGRYEVESKIIPFLSTLKGFKFGFKAGLKAEVLFINTKGIVGNWGTKTPVNIPSQALPGGIPIRANGTYVMKVDDAQKLMDEIAGMSREFTAEDARSRIDPVVGSMLMKHITKEGRDFFHLQAYADEIGEGIRADLDTKLKKSGITLTEFNIASFSYPKEVQDMVNKVASQSMIGGNMQTYQQVAFADSMTNNNGGNTAASMAQMAAGLAMGQQMAGSLFAGNNAAGNAGAGAAASGSTAASGAKFCPNCGHPVKPGAKFCENCGNKLS